MKCPRCGSENPSSAIRCRCDFKFESPPYFPVSIPKLIVMSVCTFGFYEIYWFYENWEKVKRRIETLEQDEPITQVEKTLSIRPWARALFGPFYCYSLFKRIKEATTSQGIASRFRPGFATAGWILLLITNEFPEPYYLISFLTFLPLIGVQSEINMLNHQVAPPAERNSRFSWKNIAVVVVGGSIAVLGVLGSFAGVPMVVTGEEMDSNDLAIVESLGILEPDEKIQYFYSDWDGFSMLTDRSLIVNFGADEYTYKAYLQDIISISVDYSDSSFEDSQVRVAIINREAMEQLQSPRELDIFLSPENEGDRKFIRALEEGTGVKSTIFERADSVN